MSVTDTSVQKGQGRVSRVSQVFVALMKRPRSAFGMVVILIMVFAAVFAPWIMPHDPFEQSFEGLSLVGAPLPPGGDFPLGTDLLGRDLASRLVLGTRTSLIIGVLANGIAILLGAGVGITAGYFGGWIGAILMRFTDLMMAFPALLLAIVLAAIFQPSLLIVALVIAMVNWVQMARVIYTETRSLAERDFIQVQRALGAGHLRILGSHLLPHLLSSILVFGTLGISTTVLLEATLSFLGVGVQPPMPAGATSSSRTRPILTPHRGWSSFPGQRSCCWHWPSTSWATRCATSSIRR